MRVEKRPSVGAGPQTGAGPMRRGPARAERWPRRGPGPLAAVRLALMRVRRGGGLTIAVGLGILVAVVLICTVPLYTTLVTNVQLQRELRAIGPIGVNIEVTAHSGAITTAIRDAATDEVHSLGHRFLGPVTTATPRAIAVSDNMLVTRLDDTDIDPTATAAPQAKLVTLDIAASQAHMHLVDGAFPTGGVANGDVPVLITREMADTAKLHVGSTFTLAMFGRHDLTARARVAGIWETTQENDPFWNGFDWASGINLDAKPPIPPKYPVLMTEDAFYSAGPALPGLGMQLHWIYPVDAQGVNARNMDGARQALANFRTGINGRLQASGGISGVGVATALDETIANVERQGDLLALPLYMIVAQIVGLALLFVATMASLLVDGQGQDIATLKSRGMSGRQVLAAFALQGGLLALIAAIAGPFLAALLGLLLVRTFVVGAGDTSANGSFAALAQPGALIPTALAGALLGVGAVALAAWQSARLDVLAFRREQGRASRVPFWRRYYLDVALAIICGLGYLQLGQFGGTATRVQLGAGANSPLLLAAPALLLLAGALLTLRLVPLGARLGERVAVRNRGLAPVLALAQIERSPQRYTRITLLLVLAVGLGIFAQSFDASLARNVREKAAYSVGGDVRLTQLAQESNEATARIGGKLRAVPGVQGVAGVLRTKASTTSDLQQQGGGTMDVLAVDPATFANGLTPDAWRDDYADVPLPTLMSQMRASQTGASPGQNDTPLFALVSQAMADKFNLKVHDRFSVLLDGMTYSPASCVVGAIVRGFPTMYPANSQVGYIVISLPNYNTFGVNQGQIGSEGVGASEFWLHTTGRAADSAAISAAAQDRTNDVSRVLDLRDVYAAANANPVGAGMRGLLLVGALTAALLAILGGLVQSVLAARQRTTQFAILRTLGMGGREMTGLLLGEQAVVYLFGIVGGAFLGLVLSSATLPFLQFSDTTVDPVTLGVPPYRLVFNATGTAAFFASLLVAFAVALLISARHASRVGLGKALRLGED